MVFEVVFFRSLVVIIGLALILAASVQLLAGLPVLIFGLLGFAASIPLAQRVLAPEDKSSSKESPWSKVQQRARRILVGPIPFSIKSTIWAVFVYGIYASLQLVFIVLIAESFAELTLTQAFIIAGAWGLSITLGWFSFLPAGFGVRDGLAFVMFSQMLDAPAVSLTVAASRVVTTVMDLVFVGAVELLARVMTSRQPRVPDTGVADHASDYAIPGDD
jgi:hypothetical protein